MSLAKQEVLAAIARLAPVCRDSAWSQKCCCWHGIQLAYDTVEAMHERSK